MSSLILLTSCAVYDQRKTDWQNYEAGNYTSVGLYYEVSGNGEPVILIHGFAANSFTWRYLVPELSKTHKVYSVDLKGFGRSPKPDDSAYTLADQAHQILNFIEQNNLNRVSIVGHSFGGGVALITALLLEQRSSTSLQKLVLLDSIAYQQEVPFFIELLATPFLGQLVGTTVPYSVQVSNVLRKAYYNDELVTDEIIGAYSKPLEDANAIKALTSSARSIIPSDIDKLSRDYQRIKASTLLIWGRQDEIVPLHVGQSLNEAIAESTLIIIDNCGHIPQEECPQSAIPAIITFLNDRN